MMKAVTFQSAENVEVKVMPKPQIVEPRDVIVQVELAGLCGSDLHTYFGREPADIDTIQGHEFVGVIEAVGDAVKTLVVGQRVCCPFTIACGGCLACRCKESARCKQAACFGCIWNGIGLQGAQAEFVRVPLADTTLCAVPPGVPSEIALLCGDIFTTAYFGAVQADIRNHAKVAADHNLPLAIGVVGLGPVGLLACLAARVVAKKECPNSNVIVIGADFVQSRVDFAVSNFGANGICLNKKTTREEQAASVLQVLREEIGEAEGMSAVIEAVGCGPALQLAMDIVRPFGSISSVGYHTGDLFPFTPADCYGKNVKLSFGRCSARSYMDETLGLFSACVEGNDTHLVEKVQKLVSHKFPLEDAASAYQRFSSREPGMYKVLLQL